jgi:large subunit ribosomal protein L13
MTTTKEPQYFVFDAQGKILGRLAVEIAQTLMGKKAVDYSPNRASGNWVIVINSDRVRLSGEKAHKKTYYWHSGYPGGIYSATFAQMMEKDSRKVIEKAVKGMLPKNKLSNEALKKLQVFPGEEHPYKEKVNK